MDGSSRDQRLIVFSSTCTIAATCRAVRYNGSSGSRSWPSACPSPKPRPSRSGASEIRRFRHRVQALEASWRGRATASSDLSLAGSYRIRDG
jgi:hypothetical protein